MRNLSFSVTFVCLVVASTCLWELEAGKKEPAKTPLYGWCRTRHRPLKAAQSGYDGYCKLCFKELFPKAYAKKQGGRKGTCTFCGEAADIARAGFCKSCVRARSCDECGEVSCDVNARACTSCSSARTKLDASQGILALWCPHHTSAEERGSARCRRCFDKFGAGGKCDQCDAVEGLAPEIYPCAVGSCNLGFHLCFKHAAFSLGMQPLRCKLAPDVSG